MSSKIRKIECHDCGEETQVVDKFEEIDPQSLGYCPYCGSDNIETS